jgi:hypothetical protein
MVGYHVLDQCEGTARVNSLILLIGWDHRIEHTCPHIFFDKKYLDIGVQNPTRMEGKRKST